MAYTDLSAEFDYKDLLTYQNMDKLAANDAYVHLPSGTVMMFYQASAPNGWTKQTAVDDSAMRVTSGAGGGSGGAVGISGGLTLAHTHVLSGHTHTLLHDHILDFTSRSDMTADSVTIRAASSDSDGAPMFPTTGGSATRRLIRNMSKSGNGGTSGSSTPTTASALSNVTFAYIDVIVATKV